MTNLVIDMGNTLVKLAVFQGDEMIDFVSRDALSMPFLKDFFKQYQIDNSIISSVSWSRRDVTLFLEQESNFIEFNYKTHKGLKIAYDTPRTLGKDRIAAAIGALTVEPDSDLLVIDIGSCVTYDLVTRDGTFCSGNIAPGLYMRLKAMHDYTANLPLVTIDERPESLIGKNTHDAILNGAYWGIIAEINSYYDRISEEYPEVKVILTGGEANYFADSIKPRNFVKDNLVIIGLNRVINSILKQEK